jgi:hypothetical protein
MPPRPLLRYSPCISRPPRFRRPSPSVIVRPPLPATCSCIRRSAPPCCYEDQASATRPGIPRPRSLHHDTSSWVTSLAHHSVAYTSYNPRLPLPCTWSSASDHPSRKPEKQGKHPRTYKNSCGLSSVPRLPFCPGCLWCPWSAALFTFTGCTLFFFVLSRSRSVSVSFTLPSCVSCT